MICFTLVLYFKLKFDLIYIIYKISYICFYIVKTHESMSFIFSRMSKSFGRRFFQTIDPISVLFAPMIIATCRTSLEPFHLLFHMFGVLL